MMKRFTLTLLVLLVALNSAFGWNVTGHAVICTIAQKQLTPRTCAALDSLLGPQGLMHVSNYLGTFGDDQTVDLGFIPLDGERVIKVPDRFTVKKKGCEPVRAVGGSGKPYIDNCIYFIEKAKEEISLGTLSPEESAARISLIITLLGDMHHPGHIIFSPVKSDEKPALDYNVMFRRDMYSKGKSTNYHSLLEWSIVTILYNFSPRDCAALFDIYSDAEHETMRQGDIWDWAKDSATMAAPFREIGPSEELGPVQTRQFIPLLEVYLVKAGYRLAEYLNRIFE